MAIDRINDAVLRDNGLKLNQSQCKYLLTELLQTKSLLSREVEAIDTYMKECTPALKCLYCAAKEAEHLVVQCCSDEWVVAAVHYADCEQRFVEILLDVQRYTVAVAIGIRQGKNGEGSQDVFEELYWSAVGKYETAVSKLSIVMKERKHQDDEVLLAKLKVVEVEYFGGRSREEFGGFLVTYLIRRLGSKGQSGFANTLSRFSWNMTEGIKLQGHLGQGSPGVVLQIDWLGLQCAMKILLDNPYSNYFMKQVTFLAQLRHPNVVQLYCVGDEKHKLFIIMELMECDLSSLIHRKRALSPPFPLHVALDIMLQVAKGMRYLHSNCVTHRDLESSNVLVRKSSIRELQEDGYLRVKICDFKLAKVHPTNPIFQKQTANVGTIRWYSKLQFSNQRIPTF